MGMNSFIDTECTHSLKGKKVEEFLLCFMTECQCSKEIQQEFINERLVGGFECWIEKRIK